jgi:eukaryotic-like serine/threonine-protein kinase
MGGPESPPKPPGDKPPGDKPPGDKPPGEVDPSADRETPSPETDAVQVWLSYKPGERIAGRYLLLRKLEQGGMGVVWIAHHLGLDIHVALKLVRPEAGSPEATERLVLEAQAAARLDHPAIVQILDVGRTAEGDPFLVMELLDGESLADVLTRRRTLDVVTAIQVILPIAGALGAMHAKGIIHRDVKPNNVFLAHDDAGRWQPKLIDFGIVALSKPSSSPLTRRGEIVGTPLYLPPERIWGDPPDPRDDVWALCVMLYEMVAGAHPFAGTPFAQPIFTLTGNEPQPLSSRDAQEPELGEILLRGFNARSERWPSARALGEALARELRRRGVTQDISGVSLQASWIDDACPRARAPAPPAPPAPPAIDVATTKLQRPPAIEVVTTKLQRPQPAPVIVRSAAAADDHLAEAPPLLSPITERRTSSAPPAPPVDSNRALALAAAIGILILAGLGAGTMLGRRSGTPSATLGSPVPATATARTAPVAEAPPPPEPTRVSTTTERRSPRTRQALPSHGSPAPPSAASAPAASSAPVASASTPAGSSAPSAAPPAPASGTATPLAPELKDPFQHAGDSPRPAAE